MPASTIGKRPAASIPQPGEESPIIDGLGFWHYGAVRGEWSGSTVWLADAPLPDLPDVMVKELKALPAHVTEARQQVVEGRTEPAVLLAPVVNSVGFVMLPVQGENIDVNPNYVAHIERVIEGDGEWMLSEATTAFVEDKTTPYRTLIYVVDGEARGIVSPSRQSTPPPEKG